MFAKIFGSIFDSSIADDWQTRVVFQDMLVLADAKGVVDMTPNAIARRTNIPLAMIQAAIPMLEGPDDSSRTQDHDGRRIIRLDAHRDWGWQIVNFMKYRQSATKEMLRMAEADRKSEYRARFGKSPTPPTKDKDIEGEGEEEQSRHVPKCPGLVRDMSGTSTRQDASLPLVQIFDAWNKTDGLPKCLNLSDKRRQGLKARLGEPFFAANWQAALLKLAESSFCKGDNDRGWKATFDWFASRDAVAKIMEGKYDNQPRQSSDPKMRGTFLI